MTSGRARGRISLGPACSNACIFCVEPPPLEPETLAERLAAIRATGLAAITLSGGEPTLEPESLLEAVRAARAAGFDEIGLQTNGHGLAPIARELAALGLTDVHVSIHGPDARAHDYHTARRGSFDVLWEAVAAARTASLAVVATTLITRSSFRVLSEIPILLQARGVRAWQIAVPIARGRAQDEFDRVYPRLALAVPFALHALEVARRLGLAAYVSGAPLCLLGPFAARAIPTHEPERTRALHTRCDGCAARDRCPGLDPVYLARFDGDELRPRDDRPEGAGAEPLAALFAGPGELAPRRERAIHEPPQASRRALPLYGRPKRGASEASSRATKTGEALREILPGLFEQGPEREDG